MSDGRVDFAPARWWEAFDFLRMSLEMVRGSDPWADRILARPSSLSSMLEYLYMLDNFFHSDVFFIVVSGERAGVISLRRRPGFVYIEDLGLLPEFQRAGIGQRAAKFIEDHCKEVQWGVAAMAVKNRPVHMLCAAFGGRLLGLSTATLTLRKVGATISSASELAAKRLRRSDASRAWKRWRLYEVEQVAGHDAVHIADCLLEALPWGKYLALYQDGQEIGFAVARQHKGALGVSLFTAKEFWSSLPTADLVTVIARDSGSAISHLTVTQTHANALVTSESFDFERPREQERHLVVFKRL